MNAQSSSNRPNYWVCLRTDKQVEHAKTLPGYAQDRYVPTARLDRRRQVTFVSRAETDAAHSALCDRFPTLRETPVKVPNRPISRTELREIMYDEKVRDGWWKGKRGVRLSPKPWDVYVTIRPDDESFAGYDRYHSEAMPGRYGPLPLPSAKTYEAGDILDWLAEAGYPYPYSRPRGERTHRFAVTRNVAFELRMRFG